MAAVRADQLDTPTHCPEWTVRDLLGHMVGVARRIAAVGRVEPGMSVPVIVDGVPDADWLDAWRGAAEPANDVWRDETVLTTIVHPPFRDMPGLAAVKVYVTEVVHT